MKHTTPLYNNCLPALAALILATVAVFRFPADHLRLSFEMMFEAGAVVVLAAVVARHNAWIAAFLLLSLISSVFPFYDRFSFLALHSITLGCLWFLLLCLILDADSCELILNAMCVFSLLHVCWMFLQVFHLDPLLTAVDGSSPPPVVGLMANQNEASALLAFCAPAFLRGRWRWGLVLIAAGLVMAKSVGGLLAVGAGAVVYAAFFSRRAAVEVGICGLAAGCLYCWLIDTPGLERWHVWRQGIQTGLQHWIMGAGIGHWKTVFTAHPIVIPGWDTQPIWIRAHNEFVQAAFEMGIGALVIIGGYLIGICRRVRRDLAIPTVALTVIAVNSLVNFPFRIAVTGMVAVTWLAIFEASAKWQKKLTWK